MNASDFHGGRDFSLNETKAFFLGLNAILIYVVGVGNIRTSTHRRLTPYIGVLVITSVFWAIFDTVWVAVCNFPGWTSRVSLVLMGLFFGLVFFATKKTKPILYGSIEIAAGACGLSIVAFLQKGDNLIISIFGSASSVYIIVRGLSNINDALVRADEPLPPPESFLHADSDGLEPWEFPPDQLGDPMTDRAFHKAADPERRGRQEFGSSGVNAISPLEADSPSHGVGSSQSVGEIETSGARVPSAGT